MTSPARGGYAPKYIRRALAHHFRTAAGDAAISGTFEESAKLARIVSFFDSCIVIIPSEFVRDALKATAEIAERFESFGYINLADDAKKFAKTLDTNFSL